MRCGRARALIQEWFDVPGMAAMSPALREHVRECGACRALITRWNAIELRLQTMREQTPDLSPDFTVGLQARLRAEAVGGPASRSMRGRPWLAAAVAMALLLILLVARLSGSLHGASSLTQNGASGLAASTPVPGVTRADDGAPVSSGLPLVNTPQH